MSYPSQEHQEQYRTWESIRVVREILGPSRSLDEVLLLLRRIRSGGRIAITGKGTRVS